MIASPLSSCPEQYDITCDFSLGQKQLTPFPSHIPKHSSSGFCVSGNETFQIATTIPLASVWNSLAEKVSAVQWVKALRDKLQPFARGVYVNQMGETSEEFVRAAYGRNYARLVEMKKKYDPENVLRLNQNIQPN